MNRIIVCGGRDFDDYDLLVKTLDTIIQDKTNTEIISGRAKGADTLGERYGKEHSIPVVVFPAQWSTYGKSAGFRRNTEMLKYAKQETPIIVAFWDGQSHGTKNMIDTSTRAGTTVYIVRYDQ